MTEGVDEGHLNLLREQYPKLVVELGCPEDGSPIPRPPEPETCDEIKTALIKALMAENPDPATIQKQEDLRGKWDEKGCVEKVVEKKEPDYESMECDELQQ